MRENKRMRKRKRECVCVCGRERENVREKDKSLDGGLCRVILQKNTHTIKFKKLLSH